MVSVKVYVNDEEMFAYGASAVPVEPTVPFAAKAADPADVIDEAKLSGIDPATLALLLELGRLGLKLLMQWLEKRKARRAG